MSYSQLIGNYLVNSGRMYDLREDLFIPINASLLSFNNLKSYGRDITYGPTVIRLLDRNKEKEGELTWNLLSGARFAEEGEYFTDQGEEQEEIPVEE